MRTKAANNTLFWEISGNGLKKPSYVFGTYHNADKGFVDTMLIVKSKLAAADAIVGEILLDGTDTSLNDKIAQYTFLKGTTLDKLLTTEEYNLVADFLKKATSYDIKMFNLFTPAAIMAMVSPQLAPKTFTKENPMIDQSFQDYARANNKRIFGFATADAQAKVVYDVSLEIQKRNLLKSATNWEKLKDQNSKMYSLYISQNLTEMEKMFSPNEDNTQEDIDKLLKNRNLNWLGQLPEMMEGRSLFIAVGAAHLFGNTGMIKGLRARGYKVKPIQTTGEKLQ
ncbi:MAG: TraB/GumN family protein [Bacteroidota bacterium]